jgi:acyl-CoA thioester hydrolase
VPVRLGPGLPPHRVELDVRFREVDAYGVVWHGHFLDWLEVARGRFAAHFGFDSMAALERGHRLPMLELAVEFRRSARFGDRVSVEVALEDDPRRVIALRYQVRRVADQELLATARTVQVLQGADGALRLGWPEELVRLLEAMRSYSAARAAETAGPASGSEIQKRAP